MDVGIVAPRNYLGLCHTRLHLAYATYLKHGAYLDFYRRKVSTGTVILDTSPVLPRKLGSSLLLEGIRLLKPTYVVLPSIDYSWDATLQAARDFRKHRKLPPFIGVLQGYNLDTLERCYRGLKSLCGVIALPSPLETIARRDEIIRDLGIKESILYIEVYSDPYEEIPPKGSLGICTSLPIRLAQDYRRLEEFVPTPPPLDCELPLVSPFKELARSNVEDYLEVVKEGSAYWRMQHD